MKKKALFVLAVLAIFITGCGSDGNTSERKNKMAQTSVETEQVADVSEETQNEKDSNEEMQTEEALDLTGMWVQENSDGNSYMAAVIKDEGVIGIFYVLENEEKPMTYWIGTYDAAVDADDKYSWVSENTYGGSGIFASREETKEFTYENGKISYPMTFQGKSGTIAMVRGEWDASEIPDSVFGSVKASQTSAAAPEIKDFGWIVKNEKWVCFYIKMYNPNKDIAIEGPSFRITARGANGELLGTQDRSLSIIHPEQEYVYGSQAFSVDEMPEAVDVEVLRLKDRNLKKANLLETYEPLDVVNAEIKSGKIVGEIYNPNSTEFDTAVVTMICKNAEGEIVDIESTFITDVKSGENTAFSKSIYVKDEIESVECFANQWI